MPDFMSWEVPAEFAQSHVPTYKDHIEEDGRFCYWECSCGEVLPFSTFTLDEAERYHGQHVEIAWSLKARLI